MNKEQALLFLAAHQPLPPDSELGQETIDQYEQVRQYFIRCPDPDAIPYLLNSFGEGDGFGVYPLVEDAITVHSPLVVLPHLCQALKSDNPACLYWCAQIASHYSDERLLEPLSDLISHDSTDIREAAIVALAGIDSTMAIPSLQRRLDHEDDPQVWQFLKEVLADLENV